MAAEAKSLQSCPILCDSIDGSPPGSPVPGILQARTLEWIAISFSNAWKWKVKVKSLSCIWLLATPWTAAYQAPLSLGFSRQEYWSGVPLPSPDKELDDGIKFAFSTTASVPFYPEILFSLITTKQLCDCLWNTLLSGNILPVFPLGAELIQPWAFSVSAIAVVELVRNVLCIELRSRLTVISLETRQSFCISLRVTISWRLKKYWSSDSCVRPIGKKISGVGPRHWHFQRATRWF